MSDRFMVAVTCPDCARSIANHAETCPIWLAKEELAAADRSWFDQHPFATEYRRPLQPEDLGLRTLRGITPRGRVLVRRTRGGGLQWLLPELIAYSDLSGDFGAGTLEILLARGAFEVSQDEGLAMLRDWSAA